MNKRLMVLFLCSVTLTAAAAELSNESAAEGDVVDNVYYRWIDQQGRVQYTDFEPIGVPSQRIELVPEDPPEGAVLERASGDLQADAFHDQDDQILPIEHIGPCADARRALSVLHSELPVYLAENGTYRAAWRGDDYQGVRRFLDAEDRMAAIGSARNEVLNRCSDPGAFRAEEKAFEESNRDR